MRNITKTILATAIMAVSATALADRQIEVSFIEATGHYKQLTINNDTHGYPTNPNEIARILKEQGATIEARHGLSMPSESGVPEEIDRTSIYNVGGDIYDRGMVYSIMVQDAYPEGYDVVYTIDHKGIADIIIDNNIITPVIDHKNISQKISVADGDMGHVVNYTIKDMDDEGFFMPRQVYAVINITDNSE